MLGESYEKSLGICIVFCGNRDDCDDVPSEHIYRNTICDYIFTVRV